MTRSDTPSSNAWIPPEGVTRHSGKPIPPELDFFAPPPAAIGRVLSADSSLRTSDQPMSLLTRLMTGVIVGGVVLGVIWLLFFLIPVFLPDLSDVFGNLIFLAVVGGSAGLLLGIFTFNACGFNPHCTYVGDRGWTRIHLKGSRQATPQIELLQFEAAANLYTAKTQHYKQTAAGKQRYRGTTFSHQWTIPQAKPFKLEGEYHNLADRPPDENLWHFARAAELAWSNYLWPAINDQFTQSGYVEFPISGNPRGVRVGQEYLEFILKNGSTQRADVADMQETNLEYGRFHFVHRDAKWWGKGQYLFDYRNIPNAQLFLICLAKFAGISSLSKEE